MAKNTSENLTLALFAAGMAMVFYVLFSVHMYLGLTTLGALLISMAYVGEKEGK